MAHKKFGFTLTELMIVLAVISFLAMITVPTFSKFLAKAKRAEAYMNLRSLCAAENAYKLEHGTYSTQLQGKDGIGWQPEGYRHGSSEQNFNYTYGFSSGQEGAHFFTGKLLASAGQLGQTYADKNSFLAAAVCDVSNNGTYDLLTVNQFNEIKIVKNGIY